MQPFPSAIPALALLLAACSSGSDADSPAVDTANQAVATASPAAVDAPASPAPSPTATASPAAGAASSKVIGLEGLGDLRIGQPVPAGTSWAERGAQTSDACRTVTSPDYPGVYAIVTDGRVQRITVGQRSDVKLVEGVGVGSPEADVAGWFAGFRSEPHKYEDAPAKYLTAPNAASGDPALRFEIGQDRRVRLIHVGTMPVLGYDEGCS